MLAVVVSIARIQGDARYWDVLLYLRGAQDAAPGDFVTATLTHADVYDLTGVIQ